MTKQRHFNIPLMRRRRRFGGSTGILARSGDTLVARSGDTIIAR